MTYSNFGPWFFELTPEQTTLFETAFDDIIGVEYKPIAVSESKQGGTWAFLAQGTLVSEEQPNCLMRAQIVMQDGTPEVKQIDSIGPYEPWDSLPGGYDSWDFPAEAAAKDALKKALDDILGADYQSYGNCTQVVEGTNYCILCSITPTSPEATSQASLVYVFQALDGNVQISKIENIPALGELTRETV